MVASRLSLLLALGAGVIVSITGCGDSTSRQPVYPVSGSVAYNGVPVAGASVSFMAAGSSRAATGTTDSQGNFQLSTYALNDGAIAGVHKITVSKTATAGTGGDAGGDPTENPEGMTEMYSEAIEAAENGTDSELPAKYASRGSTPLEETVSDTGENTFVLQLTD